MVLGVLVVFGLPMPSSAQALATLPPAQVGVLYSQTLSASAGVAPFAFAISAGALPAGLTLDRSAGVISGVPTAGGIIGFAVTTTDAGTNRAPIAATQVYSLTVDPPAIVGTTSPALPPSLGGFLPSATVGTPYSVTIIPSGGTPPYRFSSVTDFSEALRLPQGLTLDPTSGVISGTATAEAGSAQIQLNITDSSSGDGPYTRGLGYYMYVVSPPPPPPPPPPPVALPLLTSTWCDSQPILIFMDAGILNFTGGTVTLVAPPSHGTFVGTTIQPGPGDEISLDPSYQPDTGFCGGTDSFTYSVTTASGTSAPATVSIEVNNNNFQISPILNGEPTVGVPYQGALTQTGGLPPIHYQIAQGVLPPGLTFDGSTGTFSGVATVGGTFNITVTGTDSRPSPNQFTAVQSIPFGAGPTSIAVLPTVLTANPQLGVPFSQTFTASGGTAPYHFSISNGDLPPGLSFDASTRVVSGTVASPGESVFTVTVTDSTGGTGPFTGSNSYEVSVAGPAPTVAPLSVSLLCGAPVSINLAAGVTGTTYGFSGPSTTINIVTQPSRGTLTNLHGFPVNYEYQPGFCNAGTDSFTYAASNSSGTSAPATVTITAADLPVSLLPAALPTPQVGVPYRQILSASGGVAAYRFSVSDGALPRGVMLDGATGVMSGVPTAGGPASFAIEATDSSAAPGPFSGTQGYFLTAEAPNLALLPVSLANPQLGVAYAQALTASGGTAPYLYAISSGSLPAGLSLDTSSGAITGTAMVPGTFTFSATATDSSGGTGPYSVTSAYAVTVIPPPTASPLSASTGCDKSVAINLANGIAGSGITGVAIASRPSHGSVQVSGETATYTPAAGFCNASDSFTYTASNASGTSAPAPVAIAVGQAGPAETAVAYVANSGDGSVSVISTGSGVVSATVPVGGKPDAVAVTPDGAKAYVADLGGNTLTVFSTATNSIAGAIPVGAAPYAIAMNPDGAKLYVSNSASASVSVVGMAGDVVLSTIPIGTSNSVPQGLAVSPDGKTVYVVDGALSLLHIVDEATDAVTGAVATGKQPAAVAVSRDGGRAYVANALDGTVTVIDTAARAAVATIPVGAAPVAVAVSPDGATLYVANSIGGANPPAGSVSVVSTATDHVTATIPVGVVPDGLALTPDGTQLYVLNGGGNTVSVISATGSAVVNTIPVGQAPLGRSLFMGPATTSLAASILPGGRSVQLGNPATVFATILNGAAAPAQGCLVALPAVAPVGLTLDYQATNPSTNAPTGTPDTPVSIAGNDAFQTFVLSFKSSVPLSVTGQPLDFLCSGLQPAPVTRGVNTIDLTFSSSPVTDIVALAATVTNDGTVHVPTGSAGAFAVATINLGAPGSLSVSADTGSATLPVSLTLCQTTPATGACLATPEASVPVTVAQNATPTFSIFATATGPVAFAPGTSRIFVRFKDASGNTHGSTSVAVLTQ